MDKNQLEEKRARAREASRRWRARHPEKSRAKFRKWYHANRSKAQKIQRRWREANPDYQRKWRKKNPELYRGYQFKQYGLTLLQVEEMQAAQNNKCAICASEFSKTPNVDHDHKTGKVRGLLCSWCNTHIAAVEKPGWLESTLNYLKG